MGVILAINAYEIAFQNVTVSFQQNVRNLTVNSNKKINDKSKCLSV